MLQYVSHRTHFAMNYDPIGLWCVRIRRRHIYLVVLRFPMVPMAPIVPIVPMVPMVPMVSVKVPSMSVGHSG